VNNCTFYDPEGKKVGTAMVSDDSEVVRAGDKVYVRQQGGHQTQRGPTNDFKEAIAPQVHLIFDLAQ
tara:strand:+ start:4519 stop:4719 length:201 start_codon:yes stop_codon:yes gene_type:complete